ncbi:MAG: restriction endonuclease subunit S [Candidatus Bathyarchaeota archaeon]|nr:restriction endonuclease subunit S [Candidatus Bathyarchaeota archaeon]
MKQNTVHKNESEGLRAKDWVTQRLRFLCEFNPSKSEIKNYDPDMEVSFLPMKNIGDDGTYSLEEIRPIKNVEKKFTYFSTNDVIIAKITPCFENGKGARIQDLVNGIGFGTTELHVLRPFSNILPQFLYYTTQSQEFLDHGTSVMTGAAGQKRVPIDFIKNYKIKLPPIKEQIELVSYLDKILQTINLVMSYKQSQVEILTEKKHSLNNEVILKGIKQNISIKESEQEWLGKIPEHWDIIRTKGLYYEVNDRTESGEEELLTVSHITGITPRSEKNVNMFLPETFVNYKKCQTGDLVINTMWAWMGALGIAFQEGIVSPSYNVYRSRNISYFPKYYDKLFRTRKFISEINRFSKGVWSSRLRLYPQEFFEIKIPNPPYNEQKNISDYLDDKINDIDVLVNKIRDTIKKMVEYKKSIISSVVSGKEKKSDGKNAY